MQNSRILNIDLNPRIQACLSSQYLIAFPQVVQDFQTLINLSIKGLQQNILKLKYGLNNQDLLKYGIKNFVQKANPFDEKQKILIDQIVKICDIILRTKNYQQTTKALTDLNNILHSQCHHHSLRDQMPNEIQKIEQIDSMKLMIKEQQKFHQKQIKSFQKQQQQKLFINKNLKIHLSQKFKQFNLNFKYISIKEAIIFQSLCRCQIWFTICRQRRKSVKGFYLDPLINTFDSIVKKLIIPGNPFHISTLPKRSIQRIQQTKRVQKQKNILFDAVVNKKYSQVKRLVLSGSNLQSPAIGNQRIARQLRCSHQAAMQNDLEMCKILTSFGVDWEAEDSQKMSPIFYTIHCRAYETMKYLVQEVKVNIQKQEIQNRTPFYWACTEGEIQYIKYLYSHGANINHKSKLGRCPLSKACFLGRRDIVQFLLNCKQIHLNSQDEKGRTALHNATFGSKGGRQGQKFGTNSSDSPDCAQLLLERGLPVDMLDFQQNTALHIAMSSQAFDSIRLLMAWGASTSIVNNYGQTPIMTGAKFGHIDSVKLLYQQFNSSITDKDIFGKNILLLVAKFRQFKQNSEKNYPLRGKIQQRIQFKKLHTLINPVFNYIVDPYIYQTYSKYHSQTNRTQITQKQQQNLKQLHLTFYEMLGHAVHQQFMYFTQRLIHFDVPFPQMTLKEAKLLLEMEHLIKGHEERKLVKRILASTNQQNLHVFQLQKQTISYFVSWLIQKNDIKLLEFASDNEILIFYHFNQLKHQQQKQAFCQIPMHILVKSLPFLKQKVISFCLLNLTFDWLKFIDQNTGGNILHLLIRSRKVGTIIQINKFLGGTKMDFIRNKHLITLLQKQKQKQTQLAQSYSFLTSPLNIQFLNLLSHKDNDNITPFQLAHIVKQSSIIKILGQRLKQTTIKDLFNLEKWEVKEYTIQREIQNKEQLNIFQQGYQLDKQLDCLIEKVKNSKDKLQLSGVIPILKQDHTLISHKVNIDNDFQQQWNNFKHRPLHLIKKQSQIHLLHPLLKSSVIGIDVQYDFADGSQTIICTIQFSTLEEDYIVDMMSCTFENGQNRYVQFISKLRKQVFKPISYDPLIMILMHGSDHDLYILKSCFNTSFINFLDSSRVDLDYKKSNYIRGLSTLVKEYLHIQMSKDHQVSEWRIRPIPNTMLDYARRDSMVMPFLMRKMLLKFQNFDELKETIINSYKHARKNKKPNQPLIKKLIPI